ncbi:MAG: DRTGG domain-containing protein [Tenuifilaceae bacterium]|jgi:predicted transcriptional regulator|nr:DRTGG domain-containing protein [Bacteroidales bacterium]MDI9517681.1 DRTGG domain-containing protein [Bacteroidota bacterium]NLH57509.1 hypothetical protein [Rikenellaceae bacterium]OQC65206.1 MAG: DRTGG domain protein [Bacteroidetes bacterium ADurb.Bin008]HNV81959.1 DRTGG domain-containing protein [Tenuifilaceae bacterium]
MKIREVADIVQGVVLSADDMLDHEVEFAFASDLMSDVLTIPTEKLVLITGLSNIQTVRTAEMADVQCVVVVRNKKVTNEMVELANENHIVIIECSSSMFKTSGLLYQNGIKPIY